MEIGLYFGSFNPIHAGHLIIANHMLNETELKQIWFIVSPQNPLKSDQSLLNAKKRFKLVEESVAMDKRFVPCDVEFYLPKPSFTVNTLQYLKKEYPGHRFSIVMGSDSFKSLNQWKNFEFILDNYRIFIFQRIGFEVDNDLTGDIHVLNSPIIEISSTEIRRLIKAGKSIRYLVPEQARKIIEKKKYYRK